jgi:hypothetical protein
LITGRPHLDVIALKMMGEASSLEFPGNARPHLPGCSLSLECRPEGA